MRRRVVDDEFDRGMRLRPRLDVQAEVAFKAQWPRQAWRDQPESTKRIFWEIMQLREERA